MMSKRFFAGFLLMSLLLCAPVFSQTGTESSILGLVADPSGAVIVGAEITVTNLETGIVRTTVSNSSGNFNLPLLPQGPYTVTVSRQGFTTWTINRLQLSLGQHQRVTPVLQVGSSTQKVTVSAQAQGMQTENAIVSATVSTRQIENLPLNGRNPIQLVELTPGMRVISTGLTNQVDGVGQRPDKANMTIDGVSITESHHETAQGVPNADMLSEFNVQTSNNTADVGRQPIQVSMEIRSGTNQYHGTLWEFVRNDVFDAQSAFAVKKPKLRRNDFGGTVGGPILKDRMFFFGGYEKKVIRQQAIFDSPTIDPAMLQGDFSSVPTPIVDPATGNPFPGNQIPVSRFSGASKYFFPYLLLPNSPDNFFRANASEPTDDHIGTLRLDTQITPKQHLSGFFLTSSYNSSTPAYKPDIVTNNNTTNYNFGATYSYALTPSAVINVTAGGLRYDTLETSPQEGGSTNFANEAGIQGFPDEGREKVLYPPWLQFSGYTGVVYPALPYTFHPRGMTLRTAVYITRGHHSIHAGVDLDRRNSKQSYVSCCVNGYWIFNGQYTGDGFADYLLGLPSSGERNTFISEFGVKSMTYMAPYVMDTWNVNDQLTLSLGLRLEHWFPRTMWNGVGTSFDPVSGKAVAGEEPDGTVNLTAINSTAFANAFPNDWVPASKVGAPPGLTGARTFLSPRIGFAWRPGGRKDLVLRGGWGIYPSDLEGNASGSSVIGLPYWSLETQFFSKSNPQPWETAFPAGEHAFSSAGGIQGPALNMKLEKIYQYNLAVQQQLPLESTLTVSYVGNRGNDLFSINPLNFAPPGTYTNIQAARPYPQFSNIQLYDNILTSYYNSLQVKAEKQFSHNFLLDASYVWSKDIYDGTGYLGDAVENYIIFDYPTPYAPKGYNRGRAGIDRTHVLALNGIWELPVGRGQTYWNSSNSWINGFVGGWTLSGIYSFSSGRPLTMVATGATLGNGLNSRPNLVGSPHVANPNRNEWFNPAAFATPPLTEFGNSPLGVMDAPGYHGFDSSLMKNFAIHEGVKFQFRWDIFNVPNHVNLVAPVTVTNSSLAGKIFGAGPGREMQFAGRLIF